jgi:hypothetical protein
MKKQVWGNATWYLFHTLAYKLKPEFSSEVPILFNHIKNICNNLPCPDCQSHATKFLAHVNVALIVSSKDNLINFLHAFHNNVNKRIGNKQILISEHDAMYSRAVTYNVIKHFLTIMDQNNNNEKLMMLSFHRKRAISLLREYFTNNIHKFNP